MDDQQTGRTLAAATATLAALLVIGVGSTGCTRADTTGMTADEKAALADTVRSLAEEVDAAWKKLEPEPYLELYSEDVQFYYNGSQLPRAKFEKVVRKEMAGLRRWSTKLLDPQVEVLGPDAAVASFRYRGEAVDTAGRAREISAAVTLVFERRGGEWKIVQAHESFPPPEGSS